MIRPADQNINVRFLKHLRRRTAILAGVNVIDPKGDGWELLRLVGREVTSEMIDEWFGGKAKPKAESLVNKAKGLEVTLDHLRRVRAVHLFAKNANGRNAAFDGPLPGGLTWTTSRAQCRSMFGEPESSAGPPLPTTSIFYSPYTWDRWLVTGGELLRVEFTEGESGVRTVQLQPSPEPEPTGVDLDVYADYYQFYLQDQSSPADTSVIWDDPATTKHQLAVADGLIAVGTKRYGTVPVRVETYPVEPKLDLAGLDRVNECAIVVSTRLCIGNPISVAPLPEVTTLPPGSYGVRVLYLFQDQVTNDQTGDDRYVIQLWPTPELLDTRYLAPRPKQKITLLPQVGVHIEGMGQANFGDSKEQLLKMWGLNDDAVDEHRLRFSQYGFFADFTTTDNTFEAIEFWNDFEKNVCELFIYGIEVLSGDAESIKAILYAKNRNDAPIDGWFVNIDVIYSGGSQQPIRATIEQSKAEGSFDGEYKRSLSRDLELAKHFTTFGIGYKGYCNNGLAAIKALGL